MLRTAPISGVAGVFPEIVGGLFDAHRAGDDLTEADRALQEIIERIESLPTPWALKVFAQFRGLGASGYASAVSRKRRNELDALRAWFDDWSDKHSLPLVA